MARYEIVTQLSITTFVEAPTAEEARLRAESFIQWIEPTYEQLKDYAQDHSPIDQVQDWDVVGSQVEEES